MHVVTEPESPSLASRQPARESNATWDGELDYVYVVTNREVQTGYAERFGFEECCDALRRSLSNDPTYRLVYDGPGVSIFERVGTESAASSGPLDS